MGRVFISYVKEDKEQVEKLVKELKANEVEVWFAKEQLKVGELWENSIRHAIKNGSFFIACFSDASNRRDVTYMRQELEWALDILRQKSFGSIWFIPVRLSDCQIPEYGIGNGKTLSALHWVDLFSEWNDGIDKILKTIFPRREQFIAERYTIGRFKTEVYMGLLGGGDQVFDYQNLLFTYNPDREPLPKVLEDERKTLMPKLEADAKSNNRVLFNGPAIRLHSFDLNIQHTTGEELKRPILHFKPTCWYDYVLSNQRLDEEILFDGKRQTIRSLFADEDALETKGNIDWVKLSNILTVSVVLITRDNWTLIAYRRRIVNNANEKYAASAAENIHRWKDEPSIPGNPWSQPKMLIEKDKEVSWDYRPSECPNPFFTAIRGVREEIAKEIADEIDVKDIKFLSLAWDLGGFNPHLYALVRVNMTIQEVERLLTANRPEDGWEHVLISVPFEPRGKLEDYLGNPKWAQISKGAVLRALVHVYGYKEVDKAFK